jgi:phenylacetate-CoA ligase
VGTPDQSEPIETASRDELSALQLNRLRRTVRVVYDRVPHYRKKFETAGGHPDDLRRLSDIEAFPFTTKDDLRQNYPFGMFAVPIEDIVRLHASSGTTGKSTVVGYTRSDIETWALLIARSLRAAGCCASDKIHIAYGYGLFTGGLGFHYGGERLGATVIPPGGGFTERQVQLINDLQPDIIAATPSYMLAIADEFERQGLDPAQCSLRIGIFGAEPWSESMRAEIERRMKLHALDHYGLSEAVGPGVAQESLETKDGLTIWEDHFYPEIIDPETGRTLPEGEEGELVLGHAGHSLSHPRSHPAAPRRCPSDAPDRPHQRAQRRHADYPRGQCFPLADRGGVDPRGAPCASLRARSAARGSAGRTRYPGRKPR